MPRKEDTLADRLRVLADQRKRDNPELDAAYQRMIDRLDNAAAQAPVAGDPMPDFLLPDEEGRLVSLGDQLRHGPLVLSMNRGHWCSYCRMELCSFADIAPAIAGLGANVVSVIPEKRPYAQRLKSDYGITFPILSDIDNAYALSLGLMVWVGEEIRDRFLKSGVDISTFQGNDGWFLPVPATFVVAGNGLIVDRFVDPDFRRRMPEERIFKALSGKQVG
jgi:peroxiredoxin